MVPWQAAQPHHRAAALPSPGLPCPFPAQLCCHRKGFTFCWGFFSASPFPPHSGMLRRERSAGSALLDPAGLSLELHPARSLPPPPPPPALHTPTEPSKSSSLHTNPPGCNSPSHSEKEKELWPFLTTFVCHDLMSTQFRTFFPWERRLLSVNSALSSSGSY